jgi:hypothetical protein
MSVQRQQRSREELWFLINLRKTESALRGFVAAAVSDICGHIHGKLWTDDGRMDDPLIVSSGVESEEI